jgi:hypothetical protein
MHTDKEVVIVFRFHCHYDPFDSATGDIKRKVDENLFFMGDVYFDSKINKLDYCTLLRANSQ